jgi:uncharacterized protein YkwD
MRHPKKKNRNSSHRFAVISIYILPAIYFFVQFGCGSIAFGESQQEKAIFTFINQDRAREDLKPLLWDDRLYIAALEHSNDMAETGIVGHEGSDGSLPNQRIQRVDIYATKSAENVARDINVISAHTSLMKSLYHRENILDPEVSHVAIAIVPHNQYLYVTELFIRKLKDYSIVEGRKKILDLINDFRNREGILPLALSQTLTKTAQSNVDFQSKISDLDQPLIGSVLAKQLKGPIRINVYTTDDLERIPDQTRPNLKTATSAIGIGFLKVRGNLCEGGCYLVTLILGPPNET